MGVTIGGVTLNRLTAHPAGWTGTDIALGVAARYWEVEGICSAVEAAAIYSLFSSWRSGRLTDPAGSVGTTVLFTTDRAGGGAVTNLGVWFTKAPRTDTDGSGLFSVRFAVVDAHQAVAAGLNLNDSGSSNADLPDLGTFVWAGATFTLRQPPEAIAGLPVPSLTTDGRLVITGLLRPRQQYRIKGEVSAAGWASIVAFLQAGSTNPPSSGWWPTGFPKVSTTLRQGQTVYTVEVTLVQLG